MTDLFIRKRLEDLQEEAGGRGAHGASARTLGPVQLTLLGVGAIIGAGIFSLTGTAAAQYAGPGIVYSFVLSGLLCALTGLCYAEMASMIPVAGSAYTYAYATLGEYVAWIIGWDLVLEYAFGAVTVCVSWSGYALSLLQRTLHVHLPDVLLRLSSSPFGSPVLLGDGSRVQGWWNLPATLVALAMAAVLLRGMRASARLNTLVVALKVGIVLVFVALGATVISRANLVADPSASGLASLVPPHEALAAAGHGAGRFGWGLEGVVRGAAVVFFAYIGFDAVSTTAQEARNPKRDLPIGILASLLLCTVLYILVALVLTGVVSYRDLAVADPIAVGIDRIVLLRGWSAAGRFSLTFLVKAGALAGLTSVILVLLMGQSRIFYAMGRDGLLPWFGRLRGRHGTPRTATFVTGGFVALCAGVLPLSLVGELVSIGTLLAFVLVCLGVPILRWRSPGAPRPFKVPLPWVTGPLGALACLYVMAGLPLDTWLRLLVWFLLGQGCYLLYGRRHSLLRRRAAAREPAGQGAGLLPGPRPAPGPAPLVGLPSEP
jgi:basic amino acid/polyamine antiporter, APA family